MSRKTRQEENELADFRHRHVISAKRIVVKVGSSVLSSAKGLNARSVGRIAGEIVACRSQGRDVILVSSGSIAAGFKKIGLSEKPSTVRLRQACAAVGQAGLMFSWERAFEKRGYKVAQVLLTADDLSNRRRYLNSRNTLTTLIEWGIVPIINENDTVVVSEIKFGDNDTLGSLVAGLVEADLFINLTDLDGLYSGDPRKDKKAKFIPVVENVGAKEEALASDIPGALGSGGMYTKIMAARKLARRGIPSIIANGTKNTPITRIMAGEPVGTLFLPKNETMNKRKHWIAFSTKTKGRIVVDDGARKALIEKGKSLLPSGVVEVPDRFNPGDSVRIVDKNGEIVAIGLTNYSSDELRRLAGCQTGEIECRLGYKHSDEIVHRDNMVVGDDLNA